MTDISKLSSEEEIKLSGVGGRQSARAECSLFFFYHHFWDIVKPEVIGLLTHLDGGLLLHRINYAHVVLIPTKREIKKVGDSDLLVFGTRSKILSKFWRTVWGMSWVFSLTTINLGFLRGRSILDSIASIQEVIQFTKWNKIPEFMLKLDFEKAYNTVEWDCTLKTLQSWRFAPSWISWIRLWLQTVKVTVLVNGV